MHRALCLQFLGISRAAVSRVVKRQKPWQMIQNMPSKGKARKSILARRPFSVVEIDIADMISFGQTSRKAAHRYLLVLCDLFSGFCIAEIQSTKEGPETLASWSISAVYRSSSGSRASPAGGEPSPRKRSR